MYSLPLVYSCEAFFYKVLYDFASHMEFMEKPYTTLHQTKPYTKPLSNIHLEACSILSIKAGDALDILSVCFPERVRYLTVSLTPSVRTENVKLLILKGFLNER